MFHWLNLPFTKDFFCGMGCCLIAFYAQNFFWNWSKSCETLPLLYHLCNILHPFISKVFTAFSLYYRKIFPEMTPLSIKVLSWNCCSSITSSGSTFNSSTCAIPTTSALTFSTEVFNLSVIHEGLESASKTPVNIDILPSSHESRMFSITSRMVDPFQIYNLFCLDTSDFL